MKLFGRKVEYLFIKKAVAARAIYKGHHTDTSEIELRLLTEGDERLVLRIPPALAGKLVMELSSAYEAINPPLRGRTTPADFFGMDDFN
jgi:hypothetical protein